MKHARDQNKEGQVFPSLSNYKATKTQLAQILPSKKVCFWVKAKSNYENFSPKDSSARKLQAREKRVTKGKHSEL